MCFRRDRSVSAFSDNPSFNFMHVSLWITCSLAQSSKTSVSANKTSSSVLASALWKPLILTTIVQLKLFQLTRHDTIITPQRPIHSTTPTILAPALWKYLAECKPTLPEPRVRGEGGTATAGRYRSGTTFYGISAEKTEKDKKKFISNYFWHFLIVIECFKPVLKPRSMNKSKFFNKMP